MNAIYKKNRQAGFTLIEVLVSLFILAVGVLGIIGMQTLSLKNGMKSVSRTHAANLSYEIIDRIRSNPSQIYTVNTTTLPAFQDCFTVACTPAQLVNFDIAEWKCSFTQYQGTDTCALFLGSSKSTYEPSQIALNGDASVSCNVNAGTGEKLCLIRIFWTEAEAYTGTEEQFSYAVTVVI